MITPYQAGEMFFALRLHFTRPSYDYFKYHGKTTFSYEKFELRADKYVFAKLSQLYPNAEDFRDLVVSNCLKDAHLYSRVLLSTEAKDHLVSYRKIHESLTYVTTQDYEWLFETNANLNHWIRITHEYPPLLQAVWSHSITLETLLVMNRILNFFPMWDHQIRDTIRTPDFLLLCRKYDPFLSVDEQKAKSLLRSIAQSKFFDCASKAE